MSFKLWNWKMHEVSLITKQVFVYNNNNNVKCTWLTDCFCVFSAHVENEEQYIQALERFTDNTVYKDDPEMSGYFLSFSNFTKELTGLFKNLVSKFLTPIYCISFYYENFRPVAQWTLQLHIECFHTNICNYTNYTVCFKAPNVFFFTHSCRTWITSLLSH